MFSGKIKYLLLIVSIALLFNPFCESRTIGDTLEVNQLELSHQDKTAIIEWICEKLHENYVYPEMTEKMSAYLRKQLKEGNYRNANSHLDFRRALTRDLQAVSKDEHLKIIPSTNPPPLDSNGNEDKDQAIPDYIKGDKRNNFQFKEIKHLSGNVGYLRFDAFRDPRHAASTAVAAMNFLANCEALIIDLRYNSGGYPTLVQLILSYFFDEPVHYLNTYTRNEDMTKQYWTNATVQGPKMIDTDLYVLTSTKHTFSAAEEFAFALKNQDRATLVGETTSGGAHGIEFYYFREYELELRVPIERTYDPKTNKNWEVVGVEPDIKVSSEAAFDTAYMMALETLYKKADESRKGALRWKWEYRKATLDPLEIDYEILKSYSGQYGPVDIKLEGDELYILEPGDHEYNKLCALSETLFVIDGNDGIRGEFVKDDHGHVLAINAILADGSKKRVAKSENLQKRTSEIDAVKRHDGVAKSRSAEIDDEIFAKLGIEFVRIEGGEYKMGDSFGEGGRTEVPVHAVSLNDYYLCKTEVTFAQFDRFCEETARQIPDDEGWGRENRPVIKVSWENAIAFCDWISQKSGRPVRLPTESEWEYAAREGGKKVRFGNGKDNADASEINFDGSGEHQKPYSKVGENRQKTMPVSSFSPNGLNLYDMSGNVWEWCADWYEREYYRHSTSKDPSGPDAGIYRVIRGGSWQTGPSHARCAARGAFTPTAISNMIGFRLAYANSSR